MVYGRHVIPLLLAACAAVTFAGGCAADKPDTDTTGTVTSLHATQTGSKVDDWKITFQDAQLGTDKGEDNLMVTLRLENTGGQPMMPDLQVEAMQSDRPLSVGVPHADSPLADLWSQSTTTPQMIPAGQAGEFTTCFETDSRQPVTVTVANPTDNGETVTGIITIPEEGETNAEETR